MIYGAKIRKIRKEKGLTQKQLAERSGIKWDSAIRRIENSSATITTDTLNKIAAALEVDPRELMSDSENTIPENYLQGFTVTTKQNPNIQWENYASFKKIEELQDRSINEAREKGTYDNDTIAAARNEAYNTVMSELFNGMNILGKNNVIRYAEDISNIPKYKKLSNNQGDK